MDGSLIQFLEQYALYAAVAAGILAVLDGYTTWKVISSGKGREGNFLPAKLIEAWGLVPYLVASRLLVLCALVYEPAAGWPLSAFFAWAVANNYRNMK